MFLMKHGKEHSENIMAVICKKSTFIHIPKTGGTWVRHVLFDLGVALEEVKGQDFEPQFGFGTTHNVPIYDDRFLNQKFAFAFVRNPLTWYKSYFAYRQKYPWDKCTHFDLRCRAWTFPAFIEKVLSEYSFGYVSRMYEYLTEDCSIVGKMENLKEDLINILQNAEEDFNPRSIRHDRINVSKTESLKYGPGQVEQIISAEKETFERYNYSTKGSDYEGM